jgi:hypothetical protein
MPPTHNVGICEDFSAHAGDYVNWTGIPTSCSTDYGSCTVSQDGNNPWPFQQPSPITIPSPSTVALKADLTLGEYTYDVSVCAAENAVHTVTIVNGIGASHKKH